MPFGKELSHLIEEQINRAVEVQTNGTSTDGSIARSGGDEGRIAQIEANLQRLAESFTSFLGSQKKSKRDMVDYGLTVIALHELRIAVTAGRAIFTDLEEPLDVPYTFLQLANGGTERQIRYIYLDQTGVVLESTTDPTNIGKGYIPLALVDVWTGAREVTQDKIKDIRPRAGDNENSETKQSNHEITGNATLLSPDTGNDSFVVSALNPAGLRVNVTAGRALVGGEVLNAEGGQLDLTNHRKVTKEFISFGDGMTTTFKLYHKAVTDVVVYVNDIASPVTVDADAGMVTFAAAPATEMKITASYTFSGNYMLVFLIEKAQTNDGKPFGVISWKTGSNRTPGQPPEFTSYQHAIAKVDMSRAIIAITDSIIDNSFEVTNLTQYELQYGGKLGGTSLKAGTITGDKIAAGSIDAAKLVAGAVTADKLAAGAVTAEKIAAGAISANNIQSGTISADKFESTTWGDLSQAMRFVKSILGGAQTWKKVLGKSDLAIGVKSNVNVISEDFPSIRLDTQHHWDDGMTWDSNARWDIPVNATGYWESASIDYGAIANLQAEFWAQPLVNDPTVTMKVTARYSSDNVTWTDCETLSGNSASGYLYWVGSLRLFRYFKIKIEFTTTDVNRYVLLAYPEIRAANCQIGTEDISDGAVAAGKLGLGAVLAANMGSGALSNNLYIGMGKVANGETIPLPPGYSQDQCRWIVSFREMYFGGNVDGNDSEYCYVNDNRVVTVCGSEQRATFWANYLVIGIK